MIVAHIQSNDQAVKDALTKLFRDFNLEPVTVTNNPSYSIMIASDPKWGQQTDVAAPIEVPAFPADTISLPLSVPATIADIPAVEAPVEVAAEPTIELPAIAPPLPVVKIEPEPQGGSVVLKNLSTAADIPYKCDPGVACSELYVQNLKNEDGMVTFGFCSMTYRFPVAREYESLQCINTNPQYTDTTIRTLAVFGTPGNEEICIPVLLKLIDGSECHVVFGSDVQVPVGTPSEVQDVNPIQA